MREGWVDKGFEDCLEKVKYTVKIQRRDFLPEGLFPVISQESEFINGYWDDEQDLFKVTKPVVVFGDHTQVLKYVYFDFVLGADGVKILQPKSFLDAKFLYYFLMANPLSGLGYARHYRLLKELQLSIPPLPEQRRIVAILDEAFEGIATATANAEKNLASARELFESSLNAVFCRKGEGWEEKTIDDIAEVRGGKRVPKGHQLLTECTGHPYISVMDFNDEGGVDAKSVRYIPPEVHSKICRYTISTDDLYISIAGTIGKTGIVPMELNGANLTENACKLVFQRGISNKFIYYFTRTSSFAEQALVNTRVAAQPKLALARLKTIELGFRPIKMIGAPGGL